MMNMVASPGSAHLESLPVLTCSMPVDHMWAKVCQTQSSGAHSTAMHPKTISGYTTGIHLTRIRQTTRGKDLYNIGSFPLFTPEPYLSSFSLQSIPVFSFWVEKGCHLSRYKQRKRITVLPLFVVNAAKSLRFIPCSCEITLKCKGKHGILFTIQLRRTQSWLSDTTNFGNSW